MRSLTSREWLMSDSEPCDCKTCQDMCKFRVCWPLPEEADRMIDLGYGPRMMRDYWCGGGPGDKDIDVIAPASVGSEGRSAPYMPFFTSSDADSCTFLKDGMCELHDECKPYEGRVAHHAREAGDNHKHIAEAWNTDQGREVAARWRREIYG